MYSSTITIVAAGVAQPQQLRCVSDLTGQTIVDLPDSLDWPDCVVAKRAANAVVLPDRVICSIE